MGVPRDRRLGATEVHDGACTYVAPLFLVSNRAECSYFSVLL